jgi:hypothetical protein
MKIIYDDSTFDEETFITASTATKESTISNNTVYSIQAPLTLSCDGRDDDTSKDELELIEDGSFIEDASSAQGTVSAEDTGVPAPNDSYWDRLTKSYKEFTKAVNELDESAGVKCKETVDTLFDTANFVDRIEDASSYSDTTCGSMSCNTAFTCGTGYTTACGRSGVTEATGYTTATGVTEATGATGYTTKSGRSGVTEATGHTTATDAAGLTGPTHEHSEKYPSIEIVYNSHVDRTQGPQVTKKPRECPTRERSELSKISTKSRATQRSELSNVTAKSRATQRSELSNVSPKSRATQRSSISHTASSESPSVGDLEPSDLTLTGRPGRDESYLASRFGVTWGNAEKAAGPIVEDVPAL